MKRMLFYILVSAILCVMLCSCDTSRDEVTGNSSDVATTTTTVDTSDTDDTTATENSSGMQIADQEDSAVRIDFGDLEWE